MEVKKLTSKPKSKSGKSVNMIDNNFISDVCVWMYSFGKIIESHEHAQAHLQQLYLFIQSSTSVTPKVVEFTLSFIKKSFEQVLDKVVFYNYKYKICGHQKTTSFVESHNAQLHVSTTGPRPNHSLVTSVTRIRANCKRRSKQKKDLAERNVDRRLTARSGKDDEETQAMNHAANVLSPHLTELTVDRAMEQWQAASNFIFTRDEMFQPYMDMNGHEYKSCYLVTWNPKLPRWCHKTIPTWSYTRRVHVFSYHGKQFLHCNCGHSCRYGCACRHIYSHDATRGCVREPKVFTLLAASKFPRYAPGLFGLLTVKQLPSLI